MGELLEYAKSELKLIDHAKDDSGHCAQDAIDRDVMELLTVFETQNHSGMSATMVLTLFDRLVRYTPIKYLTGEDDEWQDVSELFDGKPRLQNKRYSALFKDPVTGRVYDVEHPELGDITFPYSPAL